MRFGGNGDVFDLESLMAAIRFLYTIFRAKAEGFSGKPLSGKIAESRMHEQRWDEKRVRQ